MALNSKHDPGMEALILQAAAEVRRLNPHIGEPPAALSEQECAQILDDDAALEQLGSASEGQRAQQMGYTAARAVDEDRGD